MIDSGVRPIPIDPAGKVTIPAGVLANMAGGECVILCAKTQSYHLLDEVGTRMWTLLADSPSIDDACGQLAAEYDADPDRLRFDLLALVEELLLHDLIEIRHE